MYSTCLFCHARLGANQAIEHLSVGRRIAFDGSRGRLWVVCRACSRWNLAPLEERWEAVEECERAFRETPLRRSTENIGLSRLQEGTELIRIGRPLLPEFAGWRYEGTLLRRRRRWLVSGVAGMATTNLALLLGAQFGFLPLVLFAASTSATEALQRFITYRSFSSHISLPLDADRSIRVRLRDAPRVRILPGERREGWRLLVPHAEGTKTLGGVPALHAAGLLLSRINDRGASHRLVRQAVREIESHGGTEAMFRGIAASRDTEGRLGRIASKPLRIALEIGANEAAESELLDGELKLLEAAWRQAEEIAGIADRLAVPAGVEAFLAKQRRGGSAGAGALPETVDPKPDPAE
jgi:hypothetical protein